MWVLDFKESLAPKNWCFWTMVLETTLESLLEWKKIQLVQPKGNQSWMFIGRTDVEAETPILVTWCEELTHLKRPWCWETLKAGGEGDNRGWDGQMASPTQWTWVWVNSGSWWWTGRPGMLQSMGSQRIRYDWATKRSTAHSWFTVLCFLCIAKWLSYTCEVKWSKSYSTVSDSLWQSMEFSRLEYWGG